MFHAKCYGISTREIPDRFRCDGCKFGEDEDEPVCSLCGLESEGDRHIAQMHFF